LAVPERAICRGMFSYSKIVFISGLCSFVVPYLPQYFIYSRLGTVETATYGVILVYFGPLSLLTTSLRSYLLPKLCVEGDDGIRDATRLLMTTACAGLPLFLAMVAIAPALGLAYGRRLPELPMAFALFTALYGPTALVGFYNMRVHIARAINYEMIVNISRLSIIIVLLFFFGTTLFRIIYLTLVVLVVGEGILFFVIRVVMMKRVLSYCASCWSAITHLPAARSRAGSRGLSIR